MLYKKILNKNLKSTNNCKLDPVGHRNIGDGSQPIIKIDGTDFYYQEQERSGIYKIFHKNRSMNVGNTYPHYFIPVLQRPGMTLEAFKKEPGGWYFSDVVYDVDSPEVNKLDQQLEITTSGYERNYIFTKSNKISILYKKINNMNTNQATNFFELENPDILQNESIIIELFDINTKDVKNIKIFGKDLLVKNGKISLHFDKVIVNGSMQIVDTGYSTVISDNGIAKYIPFFPDENIQTSYKKLNYSAIQSEITILISKINEFLPIEVTIPAIGNTNQQILNINQEKFSCVIGNGKITITNFITKNLLIKMPEGFYSQDKDADNTFEKALKNKILEENNRKCIVNYKYKDKENFERNIEFIFRKKDGSALDSNSWSDQIYMLILDKSGSRQSSLYLERLKELNYLIEFDKNGRALYSKETNHLVLTNIKNYRNPEKTYLIETNAIQPFYQENINLPQIYSFSKKIFLNIKTPEIVLVNERDKKAIIVLNANDRIDIYFDDIHNLTGANKMWLIDKGGKREIKFTNANITMNVPIDSHSNNNPRYNYSTRSSSGGLMGMGSCTFYFTLTESGQKIKNYIRFFDNPNNFSSDNSFTTSNGICSDANKNSIIQSNYSGFDGVKYIEKPSILSIEFDAIDNSKDVSVILPGSNFTNISRTNLTLNHGGFIISDFNINETVFENKFDSLYLNNARSALAVFFILGLISTAITLGTKIAEASGKKLSNDLKLVLGIVQLGLGIAQLGVGFPNKLIFHNAEKVLVFVHVIKGINTMASFSNTVVTNVVNFQNLGTSNDMSVVNPTVEIKDDTVIRWRNGLKEYLLNKDTKLDDKSKEELAELIITHAFIFASIGNISEYIKLLPNDSIEKTTLVYLDNILKYGAEYIYETAVGKITIKEAKGLNIIFMKKASISYLQGLVDVYKG